MEHRFTGHNLARLQARQSRAFLSIILFGLLMGFLLAAALVPAGLARHAAFHYAEARV